MLPEDKRQQLDNIVKKMTAAKEPPQNIKLVVEDFKKSYSQQPEKKGIGQRILDAGTSVAKFIGAEGISEQFGADIASFTAGPDAKPYVQYPTMKRVVGSALQTGANLIPGAGVAAKTLAKVAAGAGAGYTADVGSRVQGGAALKDAVNPGVATVVGGVLPVLGKITGLANMEQAGGNVAKKLEELNMRLTPVEKQNLIRDGKNISAFLSEKKIVGTPAQRYATVNGLYEQAEKQVEQVIKDAKLAVPKKKILEELAKIPDQYIDNLSEYDAVKSKIERVIGTLQNNHGDEITGEVLNSIKRNEWKNAYSKSGSEVVNEVSNDIGGAIKSVLDESIPGLNSLNKEYGKIISARRILFKASSRNQSGLLGKAAGLVAGTALGGAVAGPGGAAVGAFVGPQVTNTVATPIRSAVGAGAQKLAELVGKVPVDARGNIQMTRKALLQMLTRLNPSSQPEEETL